MTKASRTREYIIGKTAAIFNSRGFAGTSLLDLTNATGLSKGALYGNFANKEEIAMEVFRFSMQRVRAEARARLRDLNSPKAKLHALFDFYEQYVFNSPIPGGCPLMNSAVDADDYTVFIKKSVAREIEGTIGFIGALLSKGKKAGEFLPSIKSRDLAITFFCSIEGAIVVSRISSSNMPMKTVIRHCRNILEQISL